MPSPIRLAASPCNSSGSQPSLASNVRTPAVSRVLGGIVDLRVPMHLVDQSPDRRGVHEKSERVVLVPVMLIAHGEGLARQSVSVPATAVDRERHMNASMLGRSRDRSQGARMDLPGSSYLLNLAIVSTTYVGFSALLVGLRQAKGSHLTAFDAYFTQTFILGRVHRHGGGLVPRSSRSGAGHRASCGASRARSRPLPFCHSPSRCPRGDARRPGCPFPCS